MGRDKALVAVAGVPLLVRVAQAARQALGPQAPLHVVTPWPERYQGLALAGAGFMREEPRQAGPLVGFAQGLAKVQTEWVLLLACDLPGLDSATLRSWRAQLTEVDETMLAALPRGVGLTWEPLCGFYRRRGLSVLQTYVEQGGRSFQGWLAALPVQALASAPEGMLFNCNHPSDVLLQESALR